MTREDFSRARSKLAKTQKQLAALLGVSLKAVQSYEQGWRSVPLHVERHIYFLLVNQRKRKGKTKRKNCWQTKQCEFKKECPAWEFQAGHLCWFISGTKCECTADKDWKAKLETCRSCQVLSELL
jgi:hypothetical protein